MVQKAKEKWKKAKCGAGRLKEHSLVDIIVGKRRLIEIVFAAAFVICLVSSLFVQVNYDLTEYLPPSVTSKQAIDVMEKEFGYPGTARIMIEDVSVYDAMMYKQMLENVDGVDMVSWMTADVYMADDFIEIEKQTDYYKDRCAVMDVTFVEGDTSKVTEAAIDEIQALLGEKGRYAGPAIENKSLEETLHKEIQVIMVVAVIMILLILCLTTTSWIEPVLFLSIMGIAIILNQGSNLAMGTISFLSSSVSAVLQLAISMDYSVFLLHTFVRIKKEEPDLEKAMKQALRQSALSILSSAMTTFVGFLALLCMRFQIGRDVGIVLAKSIICSVATVIFLMPALILRFDGLIARAQHKSIIPQFKKVSRLVFKLRYAVVVFMALIAIPAFIAQNMNSFTFGNSALGKSEGTKVYEDTNAIEEKFGRSNLYLIIVPNETPIKERNLANELEDLYYVKSVTGISNVLLVGIPESIVPESIRKQLRTENCARMLLYTKTATESELAFETSDEIQAIVKSYYPQNSYVVGNTPSTQDLKEICLSDYMLVNILSLIGVALVVAIAFQSALLPIIVLIPINLAIYLNMTVPYLEGEIFMFSGYVIVCCIQLGATVDYSILLTNGYLDARTAGLEKREAALNALQKSLLSILTSGSILTVAGYGIYVIASVAAISSIGHMIGRGAFLSMWMVIFSIPALLTMMDKWIFREKALVASWKEKSWQRKKNSKRSKKDKGGNPDEK